MTEQHTRYKEAAIQGILAGGTGGEISKIVEWAEKIADAATERDQLPENQLKETIDQYIRAFTELHEFADARHDTFLQAKLNQVEPSDRL